MTFEDNKYITANTVCSICGDVTKMTIWRWLRDPNKRFPQPIYINTRRYWREAEVTAWMKSHSTPKAEAA